MLRTLIAFLILLPATAMAQVVVYEDDNWDGTPTAGADTDLMLSREVFHETLDLGPWGLGTYDNVQALMLGYGGQTDLGNPNNLGGLAFELDFLGVGAPLSPVGAGDHRARDVGWLTLANLPAPNEPQQREQAKSKTRRSGHGVATTTLGGHLSWDNFAHSSIERLWCFSLGIAGSGEDVGTGDQALYEDALDNLQLAEKSPAQQLALEASETTREDYMLGYMLDVETRGSASLLNIKQFKNLLKGR